MSHPRLRNLLTSVATQIAEQAASALTSTDGPTQEAKPDVDVVSTSNPPDVLPPHLPASSPAATHQTQALSLEELRRAVLLEVARVLTNAANTHK